VYYKLFGGGRSECASTWHISKSGGWSLICQFHRRNKLGRCSVRRPMYRIEEAREACKIDDDWKSLAVLDASWCRSWERPTRHLDRMTSFSRRRQNCGLVALGDLQSRSMFQWKRLQCIRWMLLLKCTTGGNIDIQVIRILTKTPATGAWFSPVGYYCKISPRENVTVVLWHCYWITRASEISEGITISCSLWV